LYGFLLAHNNTCLCTSNIHVFKVPSHKKELVSCTDLNGVELAKDRSTHNLEIQNTEWNKSPAYPTKCLPKSETVTKDIWTQLNTFWADWLLKGRWNSVDFIYRRLYYVFIYKPNFLWILISGWRTDTVSE
jgi:hypothetical protein